MTSTRSTAQAVIDHCRTIARFTDQPGVTTRTFLSSAMHECLDYFLTWAKRIGMTDARVDAAGNFRALRSGGGTKRLIIGSHLDTIPHAGVFDGLLGVVLGMMLAEEGAPLTLEVVGFSEEEGVRFGRPMIGSVAFVDGLNEDLLSLRDSGGVSVGQAIEGFGLNSSLATAPQMDDASGYLEFHIEQGPVLESMDLPLGVVEAIAGQTRATMNFIGSANHAGTTPMQLRRDAFCAAAEWILYVERAARNCQGLVATVGSVQLSPGASNVIPGGATLSLDLRHSSDEIRLSTFQDLLKEGDDIAARRGLSFYSQVRVHQKAVPMDFAMIQHAERAVAAAGVRPFRMTSGAGHDAMIVSERVPSAMIFLRSPGGVSHHPDEDVLVEDVELALRAGRYFLENFV